MMNEIVLAQQQMRKLIEDFPKHVQRALQSQTSLDPQKDFTNVLICGLGGSGIGGTIVSQLFEDECSVPIHVCKDYHIPAFVNSQTLVIVSSYSGNTEETLSALDQAQSKTDQIVCITTGGRLQELAMENNWPVFAPESGFPPRAALGFSVVYLCKILSSLALIRADIDYQMKKAINLLVSEKTQIQQEAQKIAGCLLDKKAVIYSSLWLEGVAARWRQQINENAKGLCWHHEFPEMNHNELVGWRNQESDLVVIMIKSSFDHPQVLSSMDFAETTFRQHAAAITEVRVIGDSRIEQVLYLIHLGDWLSLSIAEVKDVNPIEIDVINKLKMSLSSF